jgi:hypothetical protein
VISGVAFCPHPPLLVPEVAAGAAHELDGLRAACRAAITTVCDGRLPVLLGPGPRSLAHSPLARGTLAGFGVPGEVHLGAPTCGGGLELPPALTVGAWLVRDALGPRSGARGFSVGPDFASSSAAIELLRLAETSEIALVVLGDGSARRSTTAPGYFDERAEAFDATVADALRSGEGHRLEKLDGELASQLLAGGVPAWHAAAAVLPERRYLAQLRYDEAPYGVGYFVATWLSAPNR